MAAAAAVNNAHVCNNDANKHTPYSSKTDRHHLRRLFQDNLDKLATGKLNHSGF